MRHRYGLAVFLVLAGLAVWAWNALSLDAPSPIAVRFEHAGDAVDDARIAEGFTIEITRQLARLPGLNVRPAAHASSLRTEPADIRSFAAERDARLVLQGSVVSRGGGVRYVHASLVDIYQGALWSGSFAPESDGLFAVQDRIVTAIARELRLEAPGPRHRTVPPILQTHFLKARALQSGSGDLRRSEAVDLFEDIIRKDAFFVAAPAALATTLGGNLSIAGWPPADTRMAAAARAAYDADPQLAEANVVMGLLSARACEWTRAETYFLEGLRLDPSVTAARVDYVISTLLPVGRIRDALTVLDDALANDPGSVVVGRTLAYVQMLNRDFDRAVETSRWVLERDPALTVDEQSQGRVMYLTGKVEESLDWFSGREVQWGHRGYALALMGRREEARALADSHTGEPARQLLIYGGLNDRERAFDALYRTALDDPWRALVWMQWPEIEPVLRGDSRAAALRARLHRPADEGGCAISSDERRAVSGYRS